MAIENRIDLAFAVNRLPQYLSEPREIDMQAAKHILCCLLKATNLGISIQQYKPDLMICLRTRHMSTPDVR